MAMGHNPNTITAANTVIQFQCEGIYDDWLRLVGAQSDSFLTMADITMAQTRLGVDGKQSMGWIPHEVPLTLSLEANSPSRMVMENVQNDFTQNSEVRLCKFQVSYPSIKQRQVFSGTMVTKSGGTGIAQLLNGSTYVFNMISDGVEEIN